MRGPCGAAAAPQPLVLFGGWGMSQYFTSSAPNSLVFFLPTLGFDLARNGILRCF